MLRYRDIVPYDWNRVIVPHYKISGDSEPSDYINASFISDMHSGASRRYIAAQVNTYEADTRYMYVCTVCRGLLRTLCLDSGL